jgi:hypothetical protein
MVGGRPIQDDREMDQEMEGWRGEGTRSGEAALGASEDLVN